jgi:2-isopropylmalate synthase
MRQIEIFDTTLRDGEQAPGAALSGADKLRMARALADLGVDAIEAGFPAASAEELEAVRAIAREVTGSTIAALARATDGDVDAAARALAPAQRKRIHVFISTSEIHLDRMLRMTPGECMDHAVRAVRRASEHADEVEFSAQDATRTDIHFLVTMFQEAARAGARYLNIPDTVGYAQPAEFAKLVLAVRGALAAYSGLRISVHCHNDLGLAVANTLAAVESGADQVEVCVNGIGERGGNASLEEVVMALRVRRDHYGADTRVSADRIVPTSRLFTELTGIPVQPNKAIVGANAFAHASGIHQDGVLKDPLNYEIMTPGSVGWETRRIVVTRLSGRHGLAARFAELGIAMDRDTLDRAYGLAMDHSAVAPELDDRMLIAIAAQARRVSDTAPARPMGDAAPATAGD